VGEEVEQSYMDAIYEYSLNPSLCQERGEELKIVYTPLHGTGKIPCTEALKKWGLKNYSLVEAQAEPDDQFSTVPSPNPEDPSAMKMAVEQMLSTGADLCFGTDPDTDRLGVVVNQKGKEHFLTGNQIAFLLLEYQLGQLKTQGKLPVNPLVVKTIVTSPLQETIAHHYGAKIESTLTGFKWIGRRMLEIEEKNEDLQFVFGSEESFGYLNHPNVRDKDGVSSLVMTAELALFHKTQGRTLIDALDDIYERFGFAFERLLSFTFEGKAGAEKIARIMDNFRTSTETSFCGESIITVEDYKSLKSKSLIDGTETDIKLPTSNVIGLVFEAGHKLYLRPSGTEPKIKFYIMIQSNDGDLAQKKQLANIMADQFEREISIRANNA